MYTEQDPTSKTVNLRNKLIRGGAIVSLAVTAFGLAGCATSEVNASPGNGTVATAEASPSPSVEAFKPRETARTPEALAVMTPDQKVKAFEMSVADFPTDQAWAEGVTSVMNDWMNAGTSHDELTSGMIHGKPGRQALLDQYDPYFAEGLFLNKTDTPSTLHESVIKTALLDRLLQEDPSNPIPSYAARLDLESATLVSGDPATGAFIENLAVQFTDNYSEMPAIMALDSTNKNGASSKIKYNWTVSVVKNGNNWSVSKVDSGTTENLTK
jgi:hypothetical protein